MVQQNYLDLYVVKFYSSAKSFFPQEKGILLPQRNCYCIFNASDQTWL